MIKRKRQGYIVIYEVERYLPDTIPNYLAMVKEDYARLGPAMSVIVDIRHAAKYGLPPILLQDLREAMPELSQLDIRPVVLVGANRNTPAGRMTTALEFIEDNPRYRYFDDLETAVVWVEQWYEEKKIDRDELFREQRRQQAEYSNHNLTNEDILRDLFKDVMETDNYLSQKITQLQTENEHLNGLEQCSGTLKLEGDLLRVQHSRAKNAPPCPLHKHSRPVVRGDEIPRVRQAQNRYKRIATNLEMIAIYTVERRHLRDKIIDLWAGSWEIRGLPQPE